MGAEGGTFLGLTGSGGTLAPLFLVQVSRGTMPVLQKIFQTPTGVKLLGWPEPRGTHWVLKGALFWVCGDVGPIIPGPGVNWHHAGVSKDFSDPIRCQTAWVAPSPGDPGGADVGTFGVPSTLGVHFRLGTRSDLHFKLARGDHCVIDY